MGLIHINPRSYFKLNTYILSYYNNATIRHVSGEHWHCLLIKSQYYWILLDVSPGLEAGLGREAGGRREPHWVQGRRGQEGLWRRRDQGAQEHNPQCPGQQMLMRNGQASWSGNTVNVFLVSLCACAQLSPIAGLWYGPTQGQESEASWSGGATAGRRKVHIYKEKTQTQKEFTRALCISTECTMAAIEFISGVWSVLGRRYTNLNWQTF